MNIYLKTRDHAVSGEDFDLVVDEELSLLRTEPCPEQLDRYYQHEAYISHTDRSKTLQEKIYQLVKKYNLKKKESWLRKFSKAESRVLDVGAGTGSFVAHLRSKGWSADGVEPNTKARDVAKGKQVGLYKGLDEVPAKKYDVITLWHVLEHFKDLDREIEQLLKVLHQDGTLIIAVPNFRSFDAQHYGTFWAAYDVPRHLWHFSRPAIEKIFQRKGWKVTGTKPMLFDSFYISLMSEGYRKGKNRWVKGLWNGLRSNIHGWRTGEYSSLVYILKKASEPV